MLYLKHAVTQNIKKICENKNSCPASVRTQSAVLRAHALKKKKKGMVAYTYKPS